MTEQIEEIAKIAVDCGFRMHTQLGPGLLESVYEAVLAKSLVKYRLKVDRQVPVEIKFDDMVFQEGFRADILVESSLLIDLKSTERLQAVHGKQLLTYLRLMDLPLGLLMNFGGATFREGVGRVANNHISFF